MVKNGKDKCVANREAGKRKCTDSKKTGGAEVKRKRKKQQQGVLKFIDIDADVDENELSDLGDDEIFEAESTSDFQIENVFDEVPLLPFFPDFFDEIDEEEFDKMLEERHNASSDLVAQYESEADPSIEKSPENFSVEDTTIWKVKCAVGHERHSAFCLMQKYVDLKSLGIELQIISAFALEHKRGFIFIEAYKQCHVNEACKALCNINPYNMSPVPKDEYSHLLSVRTKRSEISVGMWARVKRGAYKGDLAQVVALDKSHKKATVKLVPRIDLKALSEKIGRGVSSKKAGIPQPRLISSRELEEYRPLIQYKRDRDIGEVFEVLDGMMLKDGYLFKKLPVDSLIFWGLTPSEDEQLRFEPYGNDEPKDFEWLSLLYGENNTTLVDNEGDVLTFQVQDLVFFGRCNQKDFGMIVEADEEDNIKILKQDSEIASFKKDKLKKALFNKKLTALDQHLNVVSVNDGVRVLEGPLKDRKGVVKQIFRGTIFLQDENEQENTDYFCCKAQTCEKVKVSIDGLDTKGVELLASGSEKIFSSPESRILAKKKSDNYHDVQNRCCNFSIGQSLRIRVGPLKGFRCRVIAIQDSNVTVKLDSQHKILTVKAENLFDPNGRNLTDTKREVPRTVQSSNLLQSRDRTRDRANQLAISSENKRQRSNAGFSYHALKNGDKVTGNPSSWSGSVKIGKKPMASRGNEIIRGFRKKPGGGSWNKQDGYRFQKNEARSKTCPNNIRGRQKGFGRGQVVGRRIDKDNAVEQNFVKRPKTCLSGRGGRGGRGVFDARKSRGRGQASPLTKGRQKDYKMSVGNSTRNTIGWNGRQVAVDWGRRDNKGGAEGWKGNADANGSQFSPWNRQKGFKSRRGFGGVNNYADQEQERLERTKPSTSKWGRGGGRGSNSFGTRGRGMGQQGRGRGRGRGEDSGSISHMGNFCT